MSDIVERLREADRGSVQRALGSRIFGEAADEIERLKAELHRATMDLLEAKTRTRPEGRCW